MCTKFTTHIANIGYRQRSTCTFVVVGHARCSSHRTRDHRWPCVQFNCTSYVEQLPTAVQSSESLDIFRRRLKTELFERSYNWHRACQTTLLLRDALSPTRRFLLWPQPWSLSTIMLLWHSFLIITRGQSNLTKSASRGAHSPVRGHPRGSKFVPLNSWGRGSY